MADNAKEYTVSLSKLADTVEQLNKDDKTLQKQLEALKKQYKENAISAESYAKAVDSIKNKQKANVQQRQALNKEMDKANQKLNESMETADRAGKAWGGFSSIIEGNVIGAIGNLKEAFAGLGGPVGIAIGAVVLAISKLKDFVDTQKQVRQEMVEMTKQDFADRLQQSFSRLSSNTAVMVASGQNLIDSLITEKSMLEGALKGKLYELDKYGKLTQKEVEDIERDLANPNITELGADTLNQKLKDAKNLTLKEKNELSETLKKNTEEAVKALDKQIQEAETQFEVLKKSLDVSLNPSAKYAKELVENESAMQVIEMKTAKLSAESFKKKISYQKQLNNLATKNAKIANQVAVDELAIIEKKFQVNANEETTNSAVLQARAKVYQTEKDIEALQLKNEQSITDLQEQQTEYKKKQTEQLQDLQDKLITDQYDRQRRAIERNYDRAVEAMRKIYDNPEVDESIKTMAGKIIDELGKVKANDIFSVNSAELSNSFSKLKVDLDKVLTDTLLEFQEQIGTAGNYEGSDNFLTLIDNELETVTKAYVDLQKMSTEAKQSMLEGIKKNYNVSQIVAYQKYFNNLYGSYSDLMKVFPQFNSELDLQAKLLTNQTDKQGVSFQKEYNSEQELEKETEKLTEAENKRYETLKKQLASVYLLEKERIEGLEDATDEQKEEYRKEALTREIVAEEQLEENHQASLENIRINAENKATVIHQQGVNERKKLDDEEAEYRKRKITEQMQSWANFAGACTSMLNGIADVYMSTANDESKSDKERETAKRKALRLQEVGIGFSMAESVASGISKAVSSSSNWVEALVAIIAMVAAVTSQFAQIRSLKAEAKNTSYATGGLIGGETQRNSTADDITANVSRGEYVMNSNSTADNLPLLDTLNYSGRGGFVRQMSMALRSLPSPIVSVETIDKTTKQWNACKTYSHI